MSKEKYFSKTLDFREDIDKELFAELQVESENGNTEKVISLLRELIERNEDSALLYAFIANAYWDYGDTESALVNFEDAIKLDPVDEKISVGFFHFLLENNREDKAFDEMRRYVNDGGVMMRYKEILADINNES